MEKSQLGQLLAKGGEGEIFTTTDPGLVAKIYHQGKMTPEVEQKLRAMLANPPHDSMRAQGRVSIAWVVDLVTVNGIVQGYVMPRLEKAQAERLNDPALNPSTCRDLIDFYNPSTRRKNFPWFHYLYLLRTARNVATAVDSFHAKGYVIGDVNESNILVALDTIVTFVDTDSFQVPDCGKVHRCQVGKPEYTPPELQGVSFKDIDRTQTHDLFGLGVIIFQLLMQGQHPFAGVYRGQGDAPEIKDRIEAGHFPHGTKNAPYTPVLLAPPFDILPSRLQRLFIQCFDNGYHNPDNRPTAKQWRDALVEAEQEMNRCAINEHHFYANHLLRCPWCELSQKFGGRDPFPAQAAIQQIWGLKMSPSLIQPTITSPPQPATVIQQTPTTIPQSLIASQSLISLTPNSQNLATKNNLLKHKNWTKIYCWIGLLTTMTLSFGFISLIIPASYINQGLAKYKAGDIQGAMADYNQAINLNPFLTNAYNNRGYAKYKLGDLPGAMADYNQAINLNLDFAQSYNGRGLVKYKLLDIHGAIEEYNRAISLDPKYVMSYINRASAENKLGDRDSAIADYDRAISLDPNNAEAYYNRGLFKDELGDKQGAIPDYHQAISLDPSYIAIYNNRDSAKY